jgi:hypothetical protein
MLPSEFLEVRGHPNLRQMLQGQVDMQFSDLRTLLRLPQAGLESGCNFTAAAILFNLIAGSSVFFYDPSKDSLLDRQARGRRFKEMLGKFYPSQGEAIPRDQLASLLYESARNPFAHSLGLDATPKDPKVKIVVFNKWPLTENEVRELEDSSARPDWAPPTVSSRILADGATELLISIPTLFWGVHRTLHALFADFAYVAAADALAATFSSQWNKYASDSGQGNDIATVDRWCSRCGAPLVSSDGGQTFECQRCGG